MLVRSGTDVVALSLETTACEALGDEFKHYMKGTLAPCKYPRWTVFADELPKTATGKLEKFKLRDI